MFGGNKHEAIDRQIKKAMLKPFTAENLNYISDLYLRKGEKELAIECLYGATSKLHVSQRDKIIALYKKIVKLAPGDEKAYKGLIDIFAKMGLGAEEVKHLILLAKVYQSRGDYEKINELYRRVHLIDPDNETAAKYFDKGKQTVSVDGERDGGSALKTAAPICSGHPETGDLPGIVPGSGSPEVLQNEMRVEIQSDRGFSGVKDAGTDEVPAAEEDWELTTVSHESVSNPVNNKVYLVIGITVLLIVLAGASGFLISKKVRGGKNGVLQKKEMAAVSQDTVEKQKEVGALKISVTRVTGSLIDESGLGKAVGQQALAANQFYAVTFQSEKGCIPKELAREPLPMISFVGGNTAKSGTTPVKGLELLNRTVYKAIVPGCGENKAVFMKMFVAHPKGQQYNGIAVRIMEKGVTEKITWD